MKASELKYVAIMTAFADHFFHGAYRNICMNCAGSAKKSSTDKMGFSFGMDLSPDMLPIYKGAQETRIDGKPYNILDCLYAADDMKKFLEKKHGLPIGYLNFDWSCNSDSSKSPEIYSICVHINYKLA